MTDNLRVMVAPELAPLIEVLSSLRDCRRREQQLLAQRDAAEGVWQRALGLPVATAGLTLRDQLRAEGWTLDDLALVGVSKASVRASLERPRSAA